MSNLCFVYTVEEGALEGFDLHVEIDPFDPYEPSGAHAVAVACYNDHTGKSTLFYPHRFNGADGIAKVISKLLLEIEQSREWERQEAFTDYDVFAKTGVWS